MRFFLVPTVTVLCFLLVVLCGVVHLPYLMEEAAYLRRDSAKRMTAAVSAVATTLSSTVAQVYQQMDYVKRTTLGNASWVPLSRSDDGWWSSLLLRGSGPNAGRANISLTFVDAETMFGISMNPAQRTRSTFSFPNWSDPTSSNVRFYQWPSSLNGAVLDAGPASWSKSSIPSLDYPQLALFLQRGVPARSRTASHWAVQSSAMMFGLVEPLYDAQNASHLRGVLVGSWPMDEVSPTLIPFDQPNNVIAVMNTEIGAVVAAAHPSWASPFRRSTATDDISRGGRCQYDAIEQFMMCLKTPEDVRVYWPQLALLQAQSPALFTGVVGDEIVAKKGYLVVSRMIQYFPYPLRVVYLSTTIPFFDGFLDVMVTWSVVAYVALGLLAAVLVYLSMRPLYQLAEKALQRDVTLTLASTQVPVCLKVNNVQCSLVSEYVCFDAAVTTLGECLDRHWTVVPVSAQKKVRSLAKLRNGVSLLAGNIPEPLVVVLPSILQNASGLSVHSIVLCSPVPQPITHHGYVLHFSVSAFPHDLKLFCAVFKTMAQQVNAHKGEVHFIRGCELLACFTPGGGMSKTTAYNTTQSSGDLVCMCALECAREMNKIMCYRGHVEFAITIDGAHWTVREISSVSRSYRFIECPSLRSVRNIASLARFLDWKVVATGLVVSHSVNVRAVIVDNVEICDPPAASSCSSTMDHNSIAVLGKRLFQLLISEPIMDASKAATGSLWCREQVELQSLRRGFANMLAGRYQEAMKTWADSNGQSDHVEAMLMNCSHWKKVKDCKPYVRCQKVMWE